MGNTTSIGRTRLVDVIGVLAVVLGLVLGLVPGITLTNANADDSCEDLERVSGNSQNTFALQSLLLDLTKVSGVDGPASFTLDTFDDVVSCAIGDNNGFAVFVKPGGYGFTNDALEQVAVEDGITDSPDFHASCSVDYNPGPDGPITVSINGSVYDIDRAILDVDQGGAPKTGSQCEERDQEPDPATVGVKKVDDAGAPLSGVDFDLYEGEGVGSSVFATCTTVADGTCSFGEVPAGTYTVDEPVVPEGYLASDALPETFTVAEGEDYVAGGDAGYVNTRIPDPDPYEIDVAPDGTNAVGNAHVFTVTLTSDGAPVAGETVQLAWDGEVGGITDVDGTSLDSVDTASCTTDEAGTCTVTVDSDDIGGGTLTGTFDTPYDEDDDVEGSAPSATGTGDDFVPYDEISDDARKDWVGLDVTIEADGRNLLGEPHTFTATVVGVPSDEPAQDVTVTIAWSGPTDSTIDGDPSSTTCVTDEAGQCSVVADSDTTTGTGTASVVAIDGVVGDDEDITVQYETGEVSADKTWVEYDLVIDADAINAVGDEHVFTATLTLDEGEGPMPVAGESVDVDVTGVGGLIGTTCDETDEAGQCTVTINSDETGETTVGVSFSATVDSVTRTYTDEAVKSWTDILLVKDPVVGDGPNDGDLEDNPDNPAVPVLNFSGDEDELLEAVYEYEITNTGPVTLFNIVLVDDRIGTILDGSEELTLAPGESTTVRGMEMFAAADELDLAPRLVDNIGTVTANPVDDPEVTVTDDDPATITTSAQVLSAGPPAITLDKVQLIGEGDTVPSPDNPELGLASWDSDEIEAGEERVIPYGYTITNTGDVALFDIELVDDKIGVIVAASEGLSLQPGESTVVTADDVVTPAEAFGSDLDDAEPGDQLSGTRPNVATVTSVLEDGSTGPSDTDDALVALQGVLDELAVSGFGAAGTVPLSLALVLLGAAVLAGNRRWERRTTA